jgi:hypothetical protein
MACDNVKKFPVDFDILFEFNNKCPLARNECGQNSG